MGGVINIITQQPTEVPELDITYRASSFGGTPKEVSSEPINSVLKSRFSMPIKNLRLSNDLTYQRFSRGQQFEYINADQIDKVNLNTNLTWEISKHQIRLGHQYPQFDFSLLQTNRLELVFLFHQRKNSFPSIFLPYL